MKLINALIYPELFIGLLLLYSRGFFEIFISKPMAYVTSLGGCLIFIGLFFIKQGIYLNTIKKDSVIIWGFLLSSLLSLSFAFSYDVSSNYAWYLLYPIFICFLFFIGTSVILRELDLEKVVTSLAGTGFMLIFIASIDQLGVISLPGGTIASQWRSPSLTGSFLHYPLILFCLASTIFALKEKINIIICVFFFGILVCLSRSGFFLIAAFFSLLACTYLKSLLKRELIGRNAVVSMTGLLFLFFIYFLFGLPMSDEIIERAGSIFDFNEVGNSGRIRRWRLGLYGFFDRNILFGGWFGSITNFSSNLNFGFSSVVESGTLQMLMNFGIVGTAIFYFMVYSVGARYGNSIYKCFVVACILQSFVYQSTEALPFICSIFIFSIFIRHFENPNPGEIYSRARVL